MAGRFHGDCAGFVKDVATQASSGRVLGCSRLGGLTGETLGSPFDGLLQANGKLA